MIQAAYAHGHSNDDSIELPREEIDEIKRKQEELEHRVRVVEIQLRAMVPPDARH